MKLNIYWIGAKTGKNQKKICLKLFQYLTQNITIKVTEEYSGEFYMWERIESRNPAHFT